MAERADTTRRVDAARRTGTGLQEDEKVFLDFLKRKSR